MKHFVKINKSYFNNKYLIEISQYIDNGDGKDKCRNINVIGFHISLSDNILKNHTNVIEIERIFIGYKYKHDYKSHFKGNIEYKNAIKIYKQLLKHIEKLYIKKMQFGQIVTSSKDNKCGKVNDFNWREIIIDNYIIDELIKN